MVFKERATICFFSDDTYRSSKFFVEVVVEGRLSVRAGFHIDTVVQRVQIIQHLLHTRHVVVFQMCGARVKFLATFS